LSRATRLKLIDKTDKSLPVVAQAELLNISRSSLYYAPRGPSTKEVRLKHRIDELYTQYPFYGSRRIHRQLQREGEVVGENTVAGYMRQMGIQAIYPGPNLSKRAKNANIYPYLLRNITAQRRNHIWGIDITYVRLQRGWMYLVAVIDWYSRYIVSWELDDTLEIPFVLRAVDRALAQATPTIWNSDQGSHFTSPQYLNRLKKAEVQISMDGKGRAIDNIFTERLWRSIKYEEVYLKDYQSPRQARQSLAEYVQFYNYRRLHQSLDYRTPAEVYFDSHLLTIIPEKGAKTSLSIADPLS